MKDITLAPSLLSVDFAHVHEGFAQLLDAGVKMIHLDVMDGIFVPSISFGMPFISSIRKDNDMIFDTHLMITEPDRYVEEFAKAGADMITVHVEACEDVALTLGHIKSLGLKCAISLNPPTPASEILPYLDAVDMVLVMSVNPGFGGQKYIESVTPKIKEIYDYKIANGLNFDIEVDGGIYPENVSKVIEAGANIIVSGSGVFRGNIAENVAAFNKVFDEA